MENPPKIKAAPFTFKKMMVVRKAMLPENTAKGTAEKAVQNIEISKRVPGL